MRAGSAARLPQPSRRRRLLHGVYLAPFGELADPRVLTELGAHAEARGFDGLFVWDHIARPHHGELAIADPWIALAALACRTGRLRFGPLVTPLARRRPHHVARQAATLDHLSGGRLVLGVGLGVDTGGELTRLGEPVNARTRAEMLDEGLDVLCRLWSGEAVDHRGPHYRADGVQFLPRPIQRPRIPIWVAARTVRAGPLRRAARFDGLCPEASPEGLAEMLSVIHTERGTLSGFEVAARGLPGDDPSPYRTAGATWWLVQLPEITTADQAFAVIDEHPGSA